MVLASSCACVAKMPSDPKITVAPTNQIMIGAPDDYISSLLPDVLRKFSAIYPRVTLELICAPSTVLAPMLADNKIDMAFFSRGSRTKGSFIRFEPMVWVGTAESQAWLIK